MTGLVDSGGVHPAGPAEAVRLEPSGQTAGEDGAALRARGGGLQVSRYKQLFKSDISSSSLSEKLESGPWIALSEKSEFQSELRHCGLEAELQSDKIVVCAFSLQGDRFRMVGPFTGESLSNFVKGSTFPYSLKLLTL